tara:strand:- start:359 stop:598 length:240 start_codon:yes stop_codon:yes gene_type:complete
MGKPIYRVIIDYGYRNRGSARAFRYGKIDTFVLTNDLEMIKKDEGLIARIKRDTKAKKKDLDIKFQNIYIEGQYGETSY